MPVVVGCDRSDASAVALRWAVEFAEVLGTDVHAVQAWSYPASAALPFGMQTLPDAAELDRQVRDELAAWIAEVLGAASDGVECVVRRGPASSELVDHATERRAELLVVGRRGLGAVDRIILGSTSRRCVDMATCPVVVVPPELPGEASLAGAIVVGLDGSEGSAKALEWAADFATSAGSEVVAVHAAFLEDSGYRPEFSESLLDEARRHLSAWTKPLIDSGIEFTTKSGKGDPRSYLIEAAEVPEVALLVVGARGKSLLSRIAVGSVAAYVIANATVPAVVVPRGDRGAGSA